MAGDDHQHRQLEQHEPQDEVEREHLRGSTLMLVGRFVALALNLAVQVVTVRYLGKTEYGMLAYGLSIASLLATTAVFGQGKSMGRLLPRFLHRGDPQAAQGAIVVAFATVSVLGGALASLAIGLNALGFEFTSNERAVTVLVVLLATSPFLAFDSLFVSLFAIVAKPTAIFFRRHVLTPAMRLAAVVFVVATSGSVEELAWAYLVVAVVGVAAYVAMVVPTLRDHPIGDARGRRYPTREMWTFGSSMLASDSVHALRTHLVVVFLEALRSVDEVGVYRAVIPVAQVNLVVLQSFELLYFPAASRLFAADRRAEVVTTYWRSAAWIAIGTFPVFLVTFSLSRPLTTLLFGDEFADSAGVLAILAVGLYANAALGLNTFTLKASGNIRLVLGVDISTAVLGVGAAVWAISQWGATGAAVATTTVFLIQNVLVHLGLRRVLPDFRVPRDHLSLYGTVVVSAVALLGVQLAVEPPMLVTVPTAALVAVALLVRRRALLQIADTFPELARIPVLRRLAS